MDYTAYSGYSAVGRGTPGGPVNTAKRTECSVCAGVMWSTPDAKCDPVCRKCRNLIREVQHGTSYMYKKQKCRCEDCKQWYRLNCFKDKPCTENGCTNLELARGLCSKHYSDWHRSQLKYTITCHCGKTAQVQRKRNKHCSYQCGMDSVNAAKANMSVQEWLSRPDFMRGRHKRPRFNRAVKKAQKFLHGTRGRTIWVCRTCKMCPNTFITQSSSTGRCCSDLCTRKNKKECGYIKAARRRAKMREAFIENVDRLEVFKRDKYKCQLRLDGCDGKTDPTKIHPHPKAPTVDHIIPLAAGVEAGGVHSMANCWTACSRCNSTKSDRGGWEQLALAI